MKERRVFTKPMNCPHHCEIQRATLVDKETKKGTLNLVLFTDNEKAVELRLTRNGIYQDDAHIFCTQKQEMKRLKSN
jgi:threonyl-tRNA synthetase